MTKTKKLNIRKVTDHGTSPMDFVNFLNNQDGSKRCMIGEVMNIVNSEKYSNDQIITWILKSAKNSCIPRDRFCAQFSAFKELKLYIESLSFVDQEKWKNLLFSKKYVLPRIGGWSLIFGTQKQSDLCINVCLSFMPNSGGKKVLNLSEKCKTNSQAAKKLSTPINMEVKKSYLCCHKCKINRVAYLKAIKIIKLNYKIKLQKLVAKSMYKPKKIVLPLKSTASHSIISKKFNEVESQVNSRMKVLEKLKNMMKKKKERSMSPKNNSKLGKHDGKFAPFLTRDKSLLPISDVSCTDNVTKNLEFELRQNSSTCLEFPQQMLKTGEVDYKLSNNSACIKTSIYLNKPINIADSPMTLGNNVWAPKTTSKRVLESTHCSEGQITKKSKFLSYSINKEPMANKSTLWSCKLVGNEQTSIKNDVANIPINLSDKTSPQKKVSFTLKKKILFEESPIPLLHWADKSSSSKQKKNEMTLKSSQMHFIDNKTTDMYLDVYYCREEFGCDNSLFENNMLFTFINNKYSKIDANPLSGKSDSSLPLKYVHFIDNITKKKLSSKKSKETCKNGDMSLILRKKKSSAENENGKMQGSSHFPGGKKRKSHEIYKKCLRSKEQDDSSLNLVTQCKESLNLTLHKEKLPPADGNGMCYKSEQRPQFEMDKGSWDVVWFPLKHELKSLFSLASEKVYYSKSFARGLKKCEDLYINVDKFIYDKEFTLNLYKREVIALQTDLLSLEVILKEERAKNKCQKKGEFHSLNYCIDQEVNEISSFHCCEQNNSIALPGYQHNYVKNTDYNYSGKSCSSNTEVANSEIARSSIKRIRKIVYSQLPNKYQASDLKSKSELHNQHYGCKPYLKGTQLLPADEDAASIDITSIGKMEHLQMLNLPNKKEKLKQRLSKYQLLNAQVNNNVQKCLGLKGKVDLFGDPSWKVEIRNLEQLVDDQMHLHDVLKDHEEKLNSKQEETTRLEQKFSTKNSQKLSECEQQILEGKLNEFQKDCKEVRQVLSEKKAQLLEFKSKVECQKIEIAKYKREMQHEHRNSQLYFQRFNLANTAIEECLGLNCSNSDSQEITLHAENFPNEKCMKIEILKEKVDQQDCQETGLHLSEKKFELEKNGTTEANIKVLKEHLTVFEENLRKLLCNHKVLRSYITKVKSILKQWLGFESSNNLFDMPSLEEEIVALNLHFEDTQQQKNIDKTLQVKVNDLQLEISLLKENVLSETLSKILLEKELVVLKKSYEDLLLEKERESKEKILLTQEREHLESQMLGKIKEINSLSEQLKKYELKVTSFINGNNEIRECLDLHGNISLIYNPSQTDEVAKIKNICNELNHQKSLVVILGKKLKTQKIEAALSEEKLVCEINKKLSVENELVIYKGDRIKYENDSSLHQNKIQKLKGEVDKINSLISIITNACYTVREYLGLHGTVNLYEDPSLREEINKLKQIMLWYKNNMKTVSVKKQQINQLLSNAHGIMKSKSVIKRQTKKQVNSKILLLKSNQLALQNEIKIFNISQLNCNSKSQRDCSSSNEDLILETALQDLKENNDALQHLIAGEQNMNRNLSLEITELKAKVAELSSLLEQEHNEASRQLDLQLAMYCATADRYREQMRRIEASFIG